MDDQVAPVTPDRLEGLVASPLSGAVLAAEKASLVLVEWADKGGGGDPPNYIAPLHVHHEDDEAWYVIEGALRLRLGDDEVEVTAGGAVLAPRGTPHTYWNPTESPTRYLLAMTPRIKALIDDLHTLAQPNPDDVKAVFRRHSSEFLGWP
jgi:mannose-6-phosphate isomerase-like protein (cupin superfamily)